MNQHWNWRVFLLLVCGFLLLIPFGFSRRWVKETHASLANVNQSHCIDMGWKPAGYRLKDHSVFLFNGFYYIVSIRLPDETGFAYGRSTDLCNWEDLGIVSSERIQGEWDEAYIWAPFVLKDNGVYYMYYTGVRRDFTQSIMLATSTNPADLDSWQRQGMILQPDHQGMLWQSGSWADCRDASVFKIGDIYYMYYTGRDITGAIIGWATSFSPSGPWHDWGATLTLSQPGAMAESSTIVSHAGAYYLLYNNTSQGEEYRIGETQVGPWSDAFPLPPGWANEIWVGQDGLDYTSFLRGYDIMIGQLTWDDSYSPPRLLIRANTYRLFIPTVLNP